MYKSCSFGNIQPTAPTKDSLDYWNSEFLSIFVFKYRFCIFVFNCFELQECFITPTVSILQQVIFVGLVGVFIGNSIGQPGLRVCKLLKVYFSERSHFLVSFFLKIIIPPTLHAAEVLFFRNICDLVFSYFINTWRLKLTEFTTKGEYGIASLSDQKH